MKPLRIALVGTWGHFTHVLDELSEVQDLQWVACAKALAEDDFGPVVARYPMLATARRFDNPEAMAGECRPDVAIVSTRPDRIAPAAAEVIALGRCHTICEKPLAITHTDLRMLHAVVAEAGVQCVAMLNNRVHPVLAAAMDASGGGAIGRVVLCNARKSYRWGTRQAWFGDRSKYGGTIPWIGIHALDFIHAVGGAEFASVSAMHGNAAHPAWPECEDHCVLALRLANDVLATASVDFLRPAAAATHGDDWIRIVGSAGVIEAHMAADACTITTDHQSLRQLRLPSPRPYFRTVIDQLRQNPGALAADTKRSFVLTHAALVARDAADQGRMLAVPRFS